MSDPSTIIKIAAFLGNSISESGAIFEAFSTEFLGVDLPSAVTQNQGVQDALNIGKNAANDLQSAVAELEGLAVDASAGEIALKFTLFGNGLRQYFQAIHTFVQAVDSAVAAAGLSGDTQAAVTDIKDRFRKVFTDYTIITALESIAPQILLVLKIFGLIDWGYEPLPEGFVDDGVSSPYVKKHLQLYKFRNLITNPGGHFIDTIGWGSADFDPEPFFRIFTEFLRQYESFDLGEVDGDPILTYGALSIRRLSSESPPALAITLNADLEETETITRHVGDTLRLNFEANYGYQGGASIIIKPPLDVSFVPNVGEVNGGLKLFFDRQESARPFTIINAGNFTLSVDDTPFGVGLDANWDITASKATINPMLFAKINRGIIDVDTSDGDSFVSSLLSGAEINGNFDLGFEWSGQDGLRITASGGIEIMLPLHVNLGIIEINNLYIALNIKDTGTLSLETSAGFTGNLGPIAAAVERMGAVTNLSFSENNESDTGIFEVDVDFKPPSGVGLSLDAGVVKGGGYLYFDFDKEEYAGALELVFSEWIVLKAIGLVTTRMPDGSKGFSMLLIITAEFGSGLQLGFGFVLIGVGGLIGVNRISNVDALRDGIQSGAIQSVLFPDNVIANAPRIISDLRNFFPPYEGIFIIGPMAKIGWGTPSLISVSLAVILEFPSVNITILGIIKVVLPDEQADILRLQVNFMGRFEPSNKLLWFYAELYDSRVLFITLEGGMGLLVNWGDNANFVVSVGGFHPQYNPPPLPFPNPPRIAANILNESWARIRIECYFAVTSNSVQFGARAELYFGLDAFNIDGHLAFDALFQFDPFFFSFGLSFSLSVKVFGIGLFSVGFSGLLEGPTPWHIQGKGKIKLLFFKISVPFEHTWGDEKNTQLDPIEVLPLVEAEFDALTNWEAQLAPGNSLLVSLRDLSDSDADQLVLHPVGKLKISQRKIPLNFQLDKVGNQKPSDINKVSLNASMPGGSLATNKTEEKFAIGQYKQLDDSKRLSSPGFEPMESGLEIAVSGEQLKASKAVKRVVRYETNIIDNNFKSFIKPFYKYLITGFGTMYNFLFNHFVKGGAVSKSELSLNFKKKMQPYDEVIKVKPQEFSVALNTNNTVYASTGGETMSFTSMAMANQFMEEQVRNNPDLSGSLHVIPNTELNQVA